MPRPPGVALPAVTVPGTAIGDGAVIRVGDGRRTGSVRLGFGDVIWASAVPQPNKATARTARRRRSIQASCVHLRFYIPSFDRWRSAAIARDGRPHLAAVGEVDHRPENHLIACFDAIPQLNFRSQIARHRHFAKPRDAVFDHDHLQAATVEHQGVGGDDYGGSLAGDMQLNRQIEPWAQRLIWVGHVDLGEQRSRTRRQGLCQARHLTGKRPIG